MYSDNDEYLYVSDATMGTTYNITIENKSHNLDKLKQTIDVRLKEINQLMSTYDDNSELSKFNANRTIKCQPLSFETMHVVKNAQEISKKTAGNFDITIGSLIEIWGFDKKNTHNKIPEQEKINDLLKKIGYKKIRIDDNCIAKTIPDITINLSAIAKGYAVDEIAHILDQHNIDNYLVEIGGEIASKGLKSNEQPWRIAIEAPATHKRSVQQIIMPQGMGIATSGDYRNYYEQDGKRYSHTIDPNTGYPIEHNLASVTVLHKKTMLADALATAMMVMGAEKSMAFANTNKIPIYMIVKNKDGFETLHNDHFKKYLLKVN